MKRTSGFTIPELLVAITLSGLFVSIIMLFMFNYWRYGYSLEGDLDTLQTRLSAGDILRDYISQSSGLVIQNSIPDPHTARPDTSLNTNQYWEKIHATPGNKTANSTEITPLLYFKKFSMDTNKTFIMNGSQPYEDEYVLYLNGANKQILLRMLANPNAPNNRLVSSCPPSLASADCPPDKVVAQDIASVDLRYFSRSGNIIDYTSIYDPLISSYIGPDFPVVEVAEFTLNLSKKPTFQNSDTIRNTTIIRIALRNT